VEKDMEHVNRAELLMKHATCHTEKSLREEHCLNLKSWYPKTVGRPYTTSRRRSN
jgi:hypothetical protein